MIIFTSASYLRLVHPELILFDGDESRDLFRTMGLVEKGIFPGLGAELITGGNLGPLEYYVLAIPYFVSSNPVFLTSFVVILNITAVIMLFVFCRDFFNIRTALIASALFAFSPSAIVFSRKIWNPYFLPLFTIIFFYAVFKVKIHKEKKYILSAMPAYACMLQFHASAILLLPFAFLLISKDLFKKEFIKHSICGFVISVVLLFPLIAFEFSHGFSNFKNIITGVQSTVSNHKYSITDKMKNFYMISITNINNIPHNSLENQCLQTEYKSNILNKSEIALFFASIIYLIVSIFAKNNTDRYKFIYLLGWYFFPLVLFFMLAPLLSNHYVSVQYPVQFVFIAILLDKLFSLSFDHSRFRSFFSVIIFLYITVLSLSQSKDIFSYYKSAKENGIINCFGLNIVLKHKLDIVNSIIKDSNNNQYIYGSNVYGCEDFVGAGGYNELIGGFKYLFEVQKRKHEIRDEQTDTTYAFLLDLIFDKIPVKKENEINRFIKWYKFTSNQKFQNWKKKYNLNCNPINKRTEQINKNISMYRLNY